MSQPIKTANPERRRLAFAAWPTAQAIATAAGYRMENHGPNCFRILEQRREGIRLIATYRPDDDAAGLGLTRWTRETLKECNR